MEAQIIEALLAFIDQGEASKAEFEEMALAVFAYQFAHNQPYRRFAIQRGRTTLTVRDWRDIPAVPITAFKDLTLSCSSPESAERVFMTSGTTQGGVRGRSYHPTLAVYDRSMLVNFRQRFMQGLERIEMGILFPDEEAMPNSSLAHYLTLAKRECGAAGSEGFIGADGLDLPRLVAALERAEASGEPYALLGASYSFVHLLDALAAGRRFTLPEGSRILDTGGFKGQSREMGADAFYNALSARLGVPRSRCINMYGMTELSTQFYDDGNAVCPPVKSGPHWIRSRVVDPVSGRDLPEGATGVLVHHDLAHFNCVSAILTEDAGVIVEGGFKLFGRVDGADSRGCSLAVEEFIRAARG